MRRLLLSVALIFVLACNLFAQQTDTPATREDVERYLAVVHARDMMHQMADAMSKPLHQMIHDQYLQNQDKLPADFEERMTRMMDDMFAGVPWDQMLDAMIPAYEKHFTHADLNALCDFYSTPAGQRILHQMPAVTAEAMQSMMPMLRQSMEKMNERVKVEVAEMTKNKSEKPDNAKTAK